MKPDFSTKRKISRKGRPPNSDIHHDIDRDELEIDSISGIQCIPRIENDDFEPHRKHVHRGYDVVQGFLRRSAQTNSTPFPIWSEE
jgi:hypothetical protein